MSEVKTMRPDTVVMPAKERDALREEKLEGKYMMGATNRWGRG